MPGRVTAPALPTVPLSTHALAGTTTSATTATVVVGGTGEPSGTGGGVVGTGPASGDPSGGGGGDMHTCTFCMRQFKYHMRLIEHMRTHTKERPFECKYCGKHFTQKGSCSRHERTCPKEKQNQVCPVTLPSHFIILNHQHQQRLFCITFQTIMNGRTWLAKVLVMRL